MEPNYYPIEPQEDGSFSVLYTGTAPTPVIIKIVPKVAIDNLKITGLSRVPMKITASIAAGSILIINGETCQITIDDVNYLNTFEGTLPKLEPGTNIVNIPELASLGIELRYKVRYV